MGAIPVIAVTESTAPPRPSPLFVQGPASLPLVEAVTARALDLKDGQIVQATVQPQGEQMALMLRGRQIGVPRANGWEVGQRLSFQVQTHADASVTLRLLGNAPGLAASAGTGLTPTTANVATPYAPEISVQAPPTTPATSAITAIALQGMGGAGAIASTPFAGFAGVFSRLGSLLYREPGMPDLRQLFEPGEGLDAVLAKISGTPTGAPGPGSAPVQAQMQAQWQAMQLDAKKVSPEAIRLALFAAMGSETSIARIRNPGPIDPKQLLHQLLKAIQDDGEADTAEVHQLKRALGDLDAAQLGAVQAQADGAMAFAVTLPFFNQSPVELRFERPPREDGKDAVFTVNAHSKSQDYGELWLKADLHGDTDLDLSMWALRESVVALAQQGADDLRRDLGAVGLSMRSFKAQPGARPQLPAPSTPQALPGLVLDFRV